MIYHLLIEKTLDTVLNANINRKESEQDYFLEWLKKRRLDMEGKIFCKKE